jgi:AcrR family transcriptional regulator
VKNRILTPQNQAGQPQDDLADRIAQQSLAKRSAVYANEVRRLLDAGVETMRRCGTTTRPRVSDIVAEAGLSNEAFYRHFPSKDALVSAILEDGAERLASYVAHQMEKAPTPEEQVRRWVEGVLSQAIDDEIAATTLAVLWNGGNLRQGLTSGTASMNAPLAGLLHEPFSELGSARPGLDASLATHAVIGMLADYLQQGTHPARAEIDHIVGFCLATVSGRGRATSNPRSRR